MSDFTEQGIGIKNKEHSDYALSALEIYRANEKTLHELFWALADMGIAGLSAQQLDDYSRQGSDLKDIIVHITGLAFNELGTDFASLAALAFENMVLRFVQIKSQGGRIPAISDRNSIRGHILGYLETILALKNREKINCEDNDLPTIGFEIEIPKLLFYGDMQRHLSAPYVSFLNAIGLNTDSDDGHLESRSHPSYSHEATVEMMKQFYDFVQIYLMNGLNSLQKRFRLSDYELPLHINYCIEDIAQTENQKDTLKYDQVGKNILGMAMGSFVSSKRLEGHHYDNLTVQRSHVAFIPNNIDNSISGTQKNTHNTRVEIRVMELGRDMDRVVEAGQYLTYAYSMAKKQDFGHTLDETQGSVVKLWREFEDYIIFDLAGELLKTHRSTQDLYSTREQFEAQNGSSYLTTKATVLHDNSRYVWDFLSCSEGDQALKDSIKLKIKSAVIGLTKKIQVLQIKPSKNNNS